MNFIRKSAFHASLALLMASLIFLIPSCKKDAEQCEKWEFQDMCIPKTPTANCYEYVRRVSSICNKELQDAHEGRNSVIQEDVNKRIERHYVRRAN